MKHAFRFAWAPLAVVILLAVLEPTLGSRVDPYLHVLGGAACQYYFYNVLSLGWSWIGTLTRFAKMIFAFTSTATVATLWELGEFISDKYFGTHLQESIPETIGDLALGLLGAIIVLTTTLALNHYENRTASSNSDAAERAV
jgi:hypothetical protein